MLPNTPTESSDEECGARHNSGGIYCSRQAGHDGQHGYGGIFWDLSDDELAAQATQAAQAESEPLPRAIYLELFDTERDDKTGVIIPNRVCINGDEVLIPDDTQIVIAPIDGKTVLTATMTLMVGTLVIHGGGSDA